MAQRWWADTKAIRDALVEAIKDRRKADDVAVGEILAGLGGNRHPYTRDGIYILVPGETPLGGNENTPTNAHEVEQEYPVVCRAEDWTEADYLETLGGLVGLVVDAVEGDALLGGLVEQMYVASIERPVLIAGDQEAPAEAQQIVFVRVKTVREDE